MSVEIRCPICSKRGTFTISEDSLKNVERGLLAVNIAEGIVCEHSFIAYVDKNLQVRDYFMADFQLEMPAIEEVKEDAKKRIPPKEQLDIDLIKLNITPSFLVYAIRMIFHKKSPIFILKEAFLKNHLLTFFAFITENSFDFDSTFLDEEEYQKQKRELKKRIIFKGKDVINDPEKVADLKKMNVEQSMIQMFYAEPDESTSLILLKNEIQKIHEMTKMLIDFIDQEEDKEILNTKKMIERLTSEYHQKISIKFFDFLLDVIEYYFEKEIPNTSKVSDFLDLF